MAVIKEFREVEEDDWIIFPKKDVRRVADYVVTGHPSWEETESRDKTLVSDVLTNMDNDGDDDDYEMIEHEKITNNVEKDENHSSSDCQVLMRLVLVTFIVMSITSIFYSYVKAAPNQTLDVRIDQNDTVNELAIAAFAYPLEESKGNDAPLISVYSNTIQERKQIKPFRITPRQKKEVASTTNGFSNFVFQRFEPSKLDIVDTEKLTGATSEYSVMFQFNDFVLRIQQEMEDMIKILWDVSESIPKEAVNLIKGLLDSIDLVVKKVNSLDFSISYSSILDKVHAFMKQTKAFLVSSRSFSSQAIDNIVHAFSDLKRAIEAEIRDDINDQVFYEYKTRSIGESPFVLVKEHLINAFDYFHLGDTDYFNSISKVN